MSNESENAAQLKEVTIYTDGAAVPNPGRGGYGVVLRYGEHSKELSGGYALTTNNRMELMAVIVGLEALNERCKVKLLSDSQYIVNAVTSGSAFRWRANDWAMNVTKSKLAKNRDLWARLLAAFEKHSVEIIWVKGHAGVEDNERCDQLAMAASQLADLPPDTGYDGKSSQPPLLAQTGSTGTPKSKITMTHEGQPCRKCLTPVIKRVPKKKSVKPNQTYYYTWYLFCPGCMAMYMVEEARREATGDVLRLFEDAP